MSALAFDERFALLVDAEYHARDNRRLGRLLKVPSYESPTRVWKTSTPRTVAGLRQLSTDVWVNDHLNVLITGPTGVGKSSHRRSDRARVDEGDACSTDVSRRSSTSSRSHTPTALAHADGARTRRRLVREAPRAPREGGPPDPRRPRPGLGDGVPATRSARGNGGSIWPAVDRCHEPAPHPEVARMAWRSDGRRCRAGPARPQRLEARAPRQLAAQGDDSDYREEKLTPRRRFAPIT